MGRRRRRRGGGAGGREAEVILMFDVSLSTAPDTEALVHMKSSYACTEESVDILLFIVPYFITESQSAVLLFVSRFCTFRKYLGTHG